MISETGGIAPSGSRTDKTVIIVGNGSSLLGGGQGGWIDSHDVVVRFNLFQTGQFKVDVGSRATVWFSNRDAESLQVRERLKLYAWECIFVHSWLNTASAVETYLQECNRLDLAIPVSGVKMATILQMAHYCGGGYQLFSTGAIGVWLMLHEFFHVRIIGFDWWNAYEQFHYCDETVFVYSKNGGHQPQREKELFSSLQSEGRLSFSP